MKITDEVRIEMLAFRLEVEDVTLAAPNVMGEFRAPRVLVYFAKRPGETWELSELSFSDGLIIRQAWPYPVPDDVQAWVDQKLKNLRGGWSEKT